MGEPIEEIQEKRTGWINQAAWPAAVGFGVGLWVMFIMMASSESAREEKEQNWNTSPIFNQITYKYKEMKNEVDRLRQKDMQDDIRMNHIEDKLDIPRWQYIPSTLQSQPH